MKKLYVVGIIAMFVAFASLGFQCQKVTDPASSTSEYNNPAYAPPFSTADFDDEESCQYACNEYYSGLLEAENMRHDEVMDSLEGGTQEIRDLRREEILRHKETVGEIQDARQQCVRDCHDQGGMDGGF